MARYSYHQLQRQILRLLLVLPAVTQEENCLQRLRSDLTAVEAMALTDVSERQASKNNAAVLDAFVARVSHNIRGLYTDVCIFAAFAKYCGWLFEL